MRPAPGVLSDPGGSVVSRWSGEPDPASGGAVVIVDCDTCEVRGQGCQGCVVSVLLGHPDERLELADDERVALEVLAGGGLCPPLRLIDGRRAAG